MSLQVEERLGGFRATLPSPKIYTTGAYLVPIVIMVGDSKRFVWVVEQFNDDSYHDGKLCSPVVLSDSLEKILIPE